MNDPSGHSDPAPHVLVVEDDHLVGVTLVAMLDEECGARLAVDVVSALAILNAADPIDVILLDCLLPGGGVSHLLEVADRRHVPVIMISGSLLELQRIGVSRPSLQKPFTGDDMIALIREVLAGAGDDTAR
jgi:DNA-binding response OmpR family regulator